jgi:hypothetical protein
MSTRQRGATSQKTRHFVTRRGENLTADRYQWRALVLNYYRLLTVAQQEDGTALNNVTLKLSRETR